MKIFIIIFCNKIEEEKLWVYLFFGCVVIESKYRLKNIIEIIDMTEY